MDYSSIYKCSVCGARGEYHSRDMKLECINEQLCKTCCKIKGMKQSRLNEYTNNKNLL